MRQLRVKILKPFLVFSYQDRVLIRAYGPTELTHPDSWSGIHQLVSPSSDRPVLIALLHDGISRHLGSLKTYKKLLQRCYRPGLRKDVSYYMKT